MSWPSIDPGELRHRITFLAPLAGTDASGAMVSYVAANPPVTARAKIEIPSGTDTIKSGQDISAVVALVTIRYQASVSQNQRFVTEQGSTFIIRAIKNLEDRNRVLEMVCVGLGANE